MMTSIIIPTYNGLTLTRSCIESIRRHSRPGTYEIIVVDNGSTDGTFAWLRSQPDVRVIRNDANEGFPRACNQGLRAASGDSLLLLNNDTIVTPRWLDQLTAALYSDARIGAVGPVTNAASYYTAMPVTYKNQEEMMRFADEFNRSDSAKWEERLKLIGFCLLFKRQVYETIGPLDERFSPGNFEDDDYCVRMLLSGYRLLLCTDTFVHHEGSATYKKNMAKHVHDMQINIHRFSEKWGFHPHAFEIRTDMIDWIREPRLKKLRILQLECGCGGTLLELQGRYPNAKLYGVERRKTAAQIAARVATVTVGKPDLVPFPWEHGSFDYILVEDPALIRKCAPYLKHDGKLIANAENLNGYNGWRFL